MIRVDVTELPSGQSIQEALLSHEFDLQSGVALLSVSCRRNQWATIRDFISAHSSTIVSTRISIIGDLPDAPEIADEEIVPQLDQGQLTQLALLDLQNLNLPLLSPTLGPHLQKLSIRAKSRAPLDVSTTFLFLSQCPNIQGFQFPAYYNSGPTVAPFVPPDLSVFDQPDLKLPSLTTFHLGCTEREGFNTLFRSIEVHAIRSLKVILPPETRDAVSPTSTPTSHQMQLPNSLRPWMDQAEWIRITSHASVITIEYGREGQFTHEIHFIHPWGLGPVDRDELQRLPNQLCVDLPEYFRNIQSAEFDGVLPNVDQWTALLASWDIRSDLKVIGQNATECLVSLRYRPDLQERIPILNAWLIDSNAARDYSSMPKAKKKIISQQKHQFLAVSRSLFQAYQAMGREADSVVVRYQGEGARMIDVAGNPGSAAELSPTETEEIFPERNRDRDDNAQPSPWLVTCTAETHYRDLSHLRQRFLSS
ncbi:hypothetical protein SISNIDRAFT_453219 [Sistotremastrum niveocremeum HHB9708]|uniref:F-box domain-containing protein n=1 Tax=Sistotremastrum niveocremeum HHB9708 TaxID=1314777 RepID=A0A164VP94_9AGAM|nr:hypothetical protein SISNIDRAFT_453219 [Sistotremastrum niveocremeum HHB9708]